MKGERSANRWQDLLEDAQGVIRKQSAAKERSEISEKICTFAASML